MSRPPSTPLAIATASSQQLTAHGDAASSATTSSSPTVDSAHAWSLDPRNPFNWPTPRKWMVTLTACLVTFLVGLNSTSVTTASDDLAAEFNISTDGVFEYTFFSVTAWNAAAAIVPLATLPLMETYGMRAGYLLCYFLFCMFVIPQALAPNFATLVVTRVFAGAFGGTLQNAVDGVAANMFETSQERVLPLTLYIFSLLGGVSVGPAFGAIVHSLDWRWVFWIELIIYGACAPLVFFALQETRGHIVKGRLSEYKAVDGNDSMKKHDEGEAQSPLVELKETVLRAVLLLTTEPTVFFFTLWSAFAFGLVFISTQSVPIVYSTSFGWESYSTGVVQVTLGIGELAGLLACCVQNHFYARSASRNRENPGSPIPERVLPLSVPCTLILAGGLFCYGWSTLQSYWIVPTIGLGLVGFSIMAIVYAVSVYITDAYARYAASAIAAVAFGENIFAAFLPFAAKPMYVRLGFGWASSLLGFVALALTVAPLMLLWKGRWIRSKSRMSEG